MSRNRRSQDVGERIVSDPPLPAAPLKTWPWGRWSQGQRVLVVARLVLGLTASVAAFVSAAVLIGGLGPQAYNAVFWRSVEYNLLRDIHAGSNKAYIVDNLGPPAFITSLSEDPLLTQEIYLRRDYIVMTVSDSIGEALVYSVLSCDQSFKPVMESPGFSNVNLQTDPLSQVEAPLESQDTSSGGEIFDYNEVRDMIYMPPSTVSSPDMMIERGAASGSNAARVREYYMGVNGACTDSTTYGYSPNLGYVGFMEEAPPEVKALRSRVAANFYAETYNIGLEQDEYGYLHPVTKDGVVIKDTIIPVTPFHFDLPTNRYNPIGTRLFD